MRDLVDHDAKVCCRVCYQTHRELQDEPELVVGYSARDPQRAYADKPGGKCLGCGTLVFFNPSAFGILSGTSNRGDGSPAAPSRVFF